ncbi:MAG: glutamate formiminotransferase, partial [Desulfobacterales bacterium]
MKRIIECVPNFSEGRNSEKIERIVEPFRAKKSLKLLDY